MDSNTAFSNQKAELEALLEKLKGLSVEMSKAIVGQGEAVQLMQIGLLAGGHCLLEGLPGLAKTLMAHTLASCLDLDFRRLQFTPDLMPSDLIGAEILQRRADGSHEFLFQSGPVFTQVLLADEINRTPPKTQAALLEAMQEHQVSFAGTTRNLPEPFFVLATQNPLEHAGTYPLPESQLDRFLLLIRVDYPTEEEEAEVLRRTTANTEALPRAILCAEEVRALQRWTREVVISDDLLRYANQLVRATRPNATAGKLVSEYVRWGAGPRAGQALILAAKAGALLDGRFAVVLDDVKNRLCPVLRHRLALNFRAQADQLDAAAIVQAVLAEVAEPGNPLP